MEGKMWEYIRLQISYVSEAWKCKNIVAWSGDFGIDQFISLDLSPT